MILRANDHSIETYLTVYIYWLQLNIFCMHLFLVVVVVVAVAAVVVVVIINLLAPVLFFLISAHLYIKCE